MRRVNVGDTELQCCIQGAGRPVLFVHGFPLDHSMWRAQIDGLDRHCRTIAVDLRGFGGSGSAPEILSMESLADDCAALLDALDVREPVVFCGLSMGGYVAWQFAARHPRRLAALVLCDTRAAADSPETAQARRLTAARVLQEGPAILADSMVDRLFDPWTKLHRPDRVDRIRQTILATSPRTIAAALRGMADRPDSTPRLGAIQVPVLAVCGRSDLISPPSEMRDFTAAIPDARFVEIPDAGHMAPLEQPAAVNAVLLDFLQTLPPRTP